MSGLEARPTLWWPSPSPVQPPAQRNGQRLRRLHRSCARTEATVDSRGLGTPLSVKTQGLMMGKCFLRALSLSKGRPVLQARDQIADVLEALHDLVLREAAVGGVKHGPS